MLKNILKLNGAQELSKNEQKNVLGGLLTQSQCEGLGGTWTCVYNTVDASLDRCDCFNIPGGGPFIPML